MYRHGPADSRAGAGAEEADAERVDDVTRESDNSSSLTLEEIRLTFDGTAWAERFPPVLSVPQAAELAQVPVGTIYDWSSRGVLHGCAAKKGKRLRILRDRFIAWLFEELDDNGGRHDAIK